LCVRGGAERVALWMTRVFPDATIYTSVYLPASTFAEYKDLNVRVLPFAKAIRSETQFKLLYPLWLAELQFLDFSGFDVVLSSSTYLAKFIRLKSGVGHAAYLYAPFRLLWKPGEYSQESLPTPQSLGPVIRAIVPLLRQWDQARTKRIPKIATTCNHMADEIRNNYDMPATVIYPPVEIPETTSMPDQRDDYFLCVGRLISHKRIDLAVQACNRLGKRLIVAGDGPERASLEKLAGASIQFVGRVGDEELKSLYVKARGLIFPSYEDFGLVPLEAQAYGVPVLAFGQGGVLETIKDGVSGMFFPRQDLDSLMDGLRDFERRRFPASQIREWVRAFDVASFASKLQDFVYST
jgi:glycosyltransferase involved in cell wall biosynthesis